MININEAPNMRIVTPALAFIILLAAPLVTIVLGKPLWMTHFIWFWISIFNLSLIVILARRAKALEASLSQSISEA